MGNKDGQYVAVCGKSEKNASIKLATILSIFFLITLPIELTTQWQILCDNIIVVRNIRNQYT